MKDARKVSEIILMVGDVSEIYVTNFQKMLGDENFSPEELDAIAFGYTKLLEESNGVLQDLRQVIEQRGVAGPQAGNQRQHPFHDRQGPYGRGG